MAITSHTRKALWGRSGGVCAKCRDSLVEPATEHDREALVAQECHIVSAAPAGPRHGPPPNGGYDDLGNLIVLCSVCHDIVDAQPNTHTVESLLKLKAKHERRVREAMRAGELPAWSLSRLPDEIEVSLIASGRQLVAVIAAADDLVVEHDQPENSEHAELIASLFETLEDDVGGLADSVRLSHTLHETLIDRLLPAGIVLYGKLVDRTLIVDGAASPWKSAVLTARYARRTDIYGPSQLRVRVRELVAAGRKVQKTARISQDGSSALIELWEHDVEAAIEESGRADLLARLHARDMADVARGLISGPWETRGRVERKLRALETFLGEVDSAPTN